MNAGALNYTLPGSFPLEMEDEAPLEQAMISIVAKVLLRMRNLTVTDIGRAL